MSAAGTSAELDALVSRRAAGEPLEQVIGWAEFCGLRITVAPGVFVPRRRTEFLVRQAALLLRGGETLIPPRPPREAMTPPGAVIVDLCCGTGALGLAVARGLSHGHGESRPGGHPDPREHTEVYAADVDPAAVRCARQNLPAGHVYEGDLYGPLPAGLRGRVQVLAANVPYVPAGEIRYLPPEARVHEPSAALDGGQDGLDVLRLVAAGAPAWLAPGGHLLSETSERQAPLAEGVLAAAGLTARVVSSGDLGATVVIGQRPR